MRIAVLMWWTTAWLPAQFALRVTTPATNESQAVAFGAPFRLEVEREWPDGWTPQVFDDALLAPLRVQLLDVAIDREAAQWREVRRYRAAAVTIGEVPARRLMMQWRGPRGETERAEAALPALHVRSQLPTPPGEIEWCELLDPPVSRAWWWAALPAAFAISWFASRLRRRPSLDAVPESHVAEPELQATALAELRALPVPRDDDAAAIAQYYTELAMVVRRFAGRWCAVPALVLTSQELLGVVTRGRASLAPCLQACDLVKFAARRPRTPEHDAVRDEAIRFVEDSRERGAEANA